MRDVADSLRVRWRLVTVVTLLGVVVGAVLSMLVTPVYTATATALVAVPRATPADVPSAVADALLVRERVTSYAHLVTTAEAIDEIRAATGVNRNSAELSDAISVENPPGSALLEISATDPSSQNAQSIANAAVGRLQSWVDQLEAPTDGGEAAVTVTITEPASLPTAPSAPRTVLYVVLGGVIGLFVGLAAALLLPVRITSLDQLRRYLDRPVLAVVARERGARPDPSSSAHQVQDALRFVDVDRRPLSVVITEATAGSGATSLAVNLAQSVAHSGEPVVLVDADVAASTLSEALDLPAGPGLTEVLVGDASVDDALHRWGTVDGLNVLACGAMPPNPADLLDSDAMTSLVEKLQGSATVIVDAPPILAKHGTGALARATAGAILVVRRGSTDRDQLRRAADLVESGGGQILGVVFLDAKAAESVVVAQETRSDQAPRPADLPEVAQTIVLPPAREPLSAPVLKTATPVEAKVIGGASGVPLVAPLEGSLPQVVDLRALEQARAGVRLGLDDDSRLAEVEEVPVGGSVVSDDAWQPPPPRAAFDPLTAPYDQLAQYLTELDQETGARDRPYPGM